MSLTPFALSKSKLLADLFYLIFEQDGTDLPQVIVPPFKLHPRLLKPVKQGIIVSQNGFADSARQRVCGIKKYRRDRGMANYTTGDVEIRDLVLNQPRFIDTLSPNQPRLIHIHQTEVGESEFGDYRQSQKGKSGKGRF